MRSELLQSNEENQKLKARVQELEAQNERYRAILSKLVRATSDRYDWSHTDIKEASDEAEQILKVRQEEK